MTNRQTLSAIDSLYEASLLPHLWPEALGKVARVCDAVGLSVSRGRIPEPALASPSLAAATAEYATDWWQHDSRTPRIEAAYRGRLLTDDDLITPDDRKHDAYYQEFLQRHGLGNVAAAVVQPMPGMRLTLNLERGSEPFGPRELDTFAQFGPHLSRALAVTVRLGLTESFGNDMARALEHAPCGIVFLTSQGQASFANEQAERLFGDGLFLKGQRLCAATVEEQARLDRLIGSILRGGSTAGRAVFLSRPGQPSSVVVQGVALPERQIPVLERLGVPSGGGLLLIHELATDQPLSVVPELQQMGLTQAQARVAEQVGRGESVLKAAARLGVAESTARTQLKAAYARLGLARQSELAILVTRLSTIRKG